MTLQFKITQFLNSTTEVFQEALQEAEGFKLWNSYVLYSKDTKRRKEWISTSSLEDAVSRTEQKMEAGQAGK